MKRVLILVLSTEIADVQGKGPPFHYRTLMETSRDAWDSVEVDGVETIFYFARSDKPNTGKVLFTDSDDDFHSMGRKTLAAFTYALNNRTFDYVFRANASLYVDKIGLLRYVQDKAETNLALGVIAPGTYDGKSMEYLWGPSYMLSRDVVQKVVDNADLWDHKVMDDVAISRLLHTLNVPLDNRGSMASVALTGNGYEFVYYENGAGGGATMKDLSELRQRLPDQFAFRVKDDANRENDVRLMKELREVLK